MWCVGQPPAVACASWPPPKKLATPGCPHTLTLHTHIHSHTHTHTRTHTHAHAHTHTHTHTLLQGYTIFVVRGNWGNAQIKSVGQGGRGGGEWFTPEQVRVQSLCGLALSAWWQAGGGGGDGGVGRRQHLAHTGTSSQSCEANELGLQSCGGRSSPGRASSSPPSAPSATPVPHPPQAKEVTQAAVAARARGKVSNAVETALARAAAGGGMMALRSKRKAPEAEGGCCCALRLPMVSAVAAGGQWRCTASARRQRADRVRSSQNDCAGVGVRRGWASTPLALADRPPSWPGCPLQARWMRTLTWRPPLLRACSRPAAEQGPAAKVGCCCWGCGTF